jgi:fructosamine-3-kinase
MTAAEFVKGAPAPLEAAGLRWLAQAGARVPEILVDEPDHLVLRRIEPGRLNAAGEEDFGRMLAHMHNAGAPRFGSLPADGRFFVGRCELESPDGDDWNAYYLQHRCLPLARRAGLGDVVGLAMLQLFGSVSARTAAAYEEVSPLAAGWRERIPLWQLFPLLVHAVLFGGSYTQQAHALAVRLAR